MTTRTLDFKVNGQMIEKVGDFSGLVKGSKGYLKARFSFSEEWSGCKVAASFWLYGKEYAVPVRGKVCEIPEEALTGNEFKVSVTGARAGYLISTNKIKVEQEG